LTPRLQAQQQGKAPWSLSFSYGRALQASVLKIWSADSSRAAEAKQMAVALAAANAAAVRGKYDAAGKHPSVTSDSSLREAFRGWHGPTASAPAAAVAVAR
jgi:fructose-bisphosphate aldolase class I